MLFSKEFFVNLGFNFEQELKPAKLSFEHNPTLSEKIKNSVFFYKNPNQTNMILEVPVRFEYEAKDYQGLLVAVSGGASKL